MCRHCEVPKEKAIARRGQPRVQNAHRKILCQVARTEQAVGRSKNVDAAVRERAAFERALRVGRACVIKGLTRRGRQTLVVFVVSGGRRHGQRRRRSHGREAAELGAVVRSRLLVLGRREDLGVRACLVGVPLGRAVIARHRGGTPTTRATRCEADARIARPGANRHRNSGQWRKSCFSSETCKQRGATSHGRMERPASHLPAPAAVGAAVRPFSQCHAARCTLYRRDGAELTVARRALRHEACCSCSRGACGSAWRCGVGRRSHMRMGVKAGEFHLLLLRRAQRAATHAFHLSAATRATLHGAGAVAARVSVA